MLTTSPPPPWAAMGRAMSIQFAPLPLFILKWSAGWSAFSQRRLELGLRLSDDASGRTIWIADAHRDDGKRFVVRADEKLTAFMELEWAIRLDTNGRPDISPSLTRIEIGNSR